MEILIKYDVQDHFWESLFILERNQYKRNKEWDKNQDKNRLKGVMSDSKNAHMYSIL